jgi:hypothetical protein
MNKLELIKYLIQLSKSKHIITDFKKDLSHAVLKVMRSSVPFPQIIGTTRKLQFDCDEMIRTRELQGGITLTQLIELNKISNNHPIIEKASLTEKELRQKYSILDEQNKLVLILEGEYAGEILQYKDNQDETEIIINYEKT